MSSTVTSGSFAKSALTDEPDGQEFEKNSQDMMDWLYEIKKNIDILLDLRVKCADMELSLTSYYSPEIKGKLKMCQDNAEKCECTMQASKEALGAKQ